MPFPRAGGAVSAQSILDDATSAVSTMQLQVRGHVIGVATESGAAAELIEDTFFPSGAFGVKIETTPAAATDYLIEDRVAAAEDVQSFLGAVAQQVVAGEYELIRALRRPRYDVGDGITVFSLADYNTGEPAALVRQQHRFVLVRSPSSISDRWPSRIARDVVTRLATADGSLILHAAAFAVGDAGYLVVGDSGAGKSTTAIGMARLLEGGGWIGNDRIHLDGDTTGFHITACPVNLAVNKGSLDAMGVTGAETWDLQAGFPAPDSDWDQFMGEDKLRLSPREVTRYLDVPIVARARLAGVIFPRVDLAADYEFGRADNTVAHETLARNYRSVEDNLYGEDWLEIADDTVNTPPSPSVLFDELSTVPLMRCTLGSGDDLVNLATDLGKLRSVTAGSRLS